MKNIKNVLRNQKMKKKISKNPFFFKKSKILFKIFSFAKKKTIILVLPIEVISVPSEFSSPPCFRIPGGWSERYGQRTN